VIEVTPQVAEAPTAGVTPWVLLAIADPRKRRAARKAWEDAGFAVEIVSRAADVVECMKVMTPSLVVIGDQIYRPAAR
jgi:hypothetical protein